MNSSSGEQIARPPEFKICCIETGWLPLTRRREMQILKIMLVMQRT